MSSSARAAILLVRHGITDDNQNNVFQGQGGRGLNGAGKEQADRLAKRLSGAPVVAVYSSDLERARDTAEILAAPHSLSITLDRELREVDVGAWTGLSHDDVRARFAEEWAAWQRGLDVRRGGGETYEELGERLIRALRRISAAHDGEEGAVIAVSHGGAIRAVMQRLLGAGFSPEAIVPADNTSITLLEPAPRDSDGFRVLVYNDTSHLGDDVLARLARRSRR
jgi:probable phosphoglycerate mutase